MTKPILIKPVAAAWLAAAIDGEGSISASLHLVRRHNRQTIKMKFQVTVSNTMRVYPDRAYELSGWRGGVADLKPSRQNFAGGRGRYYQWAAGGWEDVEIVLRSVRPYLTIKATKASAVLACCMFRKTLLSAGHLHTDAMRDLAIFVRDNWLKIYQADGKALNACERFIVIESRRLSS